MKAMKKRALALVISAILCLYVGVIPTKAAANVVIYLSASSVSIGQNVTATISISGSEISAYTIYVSYSSSILQYNSASGATVGGGGGTLTISGTGAGSISISFTAIANGSASISTSGSEVYDINYNAISISHAGATVTVATAEQPTTTESNSDKKTTEDGKTEATTEDDGRSSNCNLASLQVSPGTLSPAFSSSTTSYSLQVDEDVSSIVVSATAEDSKASTAVSGANSIQKGENTVRVTVTAENGAVRVYTIRVIAGEDVGEAKVTIDGKEYFFTNSEDGLDIPEGFTPKKVDYKDWEVLAFESPNKKLYVVYLYDKEQDTQGAWYRMDAEKDEFTPYKEFSSNYNRYILLPVPDDVEIPEGFVKRTLNITENDVFQFEDGEDQNIYLIYAMNVEGAEGFYLYDTVEGAFIRYVPMTLVKEKIVEATPTVATPQEPVAEPKDEGFFTRQVLLYFLMGAGAIMLILLICVIIFATRIHKQNQEIKDADDMINQLASANKNVNASLLDAVDYEQEEATLPESERLPEDGALSESESLSEDETPQEPYYVDSDIEPVEERKMKDAQSMAEETDGEMEEAAPISPIEIPTVSLGNEEEASKSALDTFAAEGEAYVEKTEKERAHEDYEKRSEEINNRIMSNYDANKDSVFAGEEDLDS